MEPNIIELDQGWVYIQQGITKLKRILEGLPEAQFNSEEYMMPYTTIYKMCTQRPPYDYSQQLYEKYREAFEEYITTTVMPSLSKKDDEFMLREFVRRWANHKIMVRWLSRFFRYLDRYFIKRKSLPALNEVGLSCFRDLVENANARAAVIGLIDKERKGEQIDRALLKNVIDIFVEIGMGQMDAYEIPVTRTRRRSESFEGFGNDILEQLLLHQKFQKLVELQLVSRQWRLLISHPEFQESYAQKHEASSVFFTLLNSSNKVGIVRFLSAEKYTVATYQIDPPTSAGPLSLNNILGSCLGLVCLGNTTTSGFRAEENILFLNPWTRRVGLVKNTIHCGWDRGHYGLGFDFKSKDFKLLKVLPPVHMEFQKKPSVKSAAEMVHTMIYSWRNASWRQIQTDDWGFSLVRRPGIFLEGKLYWSGTVWERHGEFQSSNDALVSFDLSTETFGSIDLPQELQGVLFCSFGVAGGKLTAVVCKCQVVEVWQYVDNGFRLMSILRTKPGMNCLMQPLLQAVNAMVVLQRSHKITLYNQSDHSKLHALSFDKHGGTIMEAVSLVGSMFSPTYDCSEDKKC